MASKSMTLAREIAMDSFVEVLENYQKPEVMLDKAFTKYGNNIKRIDRNLAKELLYGSLRWYSKIYWILQNISRKDLDKSSPQIRAALVIGTYQIFYMDRIPDRAAVNESVEYIRKRRQTSATSFINGILRKVASKSQYFPKPDKKEKPLDYLSLQFAHPSWMVKKWSQNFSFERLELMLAANNQPPPFTIRINTLKTTIENTGELQSALLKEEKIKSDRRPLRTALRLSGSPPFSKDSLFSKGLFAVQDEASQLIGYLVNPESGEKIADACSGPGGKLSHVYELGKEELKLFSIEKDNSQMDRIKQNMERLGHAKGVEYFETSFLDWKPKSKLDKVLLDAPCTGLGVLRRHPEGKWHKKANGQKEIIKIQQQLIDKAIESLKDGGELIYSVCSFELNECEHHLTRLLDTFGDKIEVISPATRLPNYYKKYVTRKNYLAVYAGNPDDMDGFSAFIIRVKK